MIVMNIVSKLKIVEFLGLEKSYHQRIVLFVLWGLVICDQIQKKNETPF